MSHLLDTNSFIDHLHNTSEFSRIPGLLLEDWQ